MFNNNKINISSCDKNARPSCRLWCESDLKQIAHRNWCVKIAGVHRMRLN